MADESNASYRLIRDELIEEFAVEGYEVAEGAPPVGTGGQPQVPCIVILLNRSGETSYQGGVRAVVRDTWLAKYVGPDDGSDKARKASDRIDNRLTAIRNAPGPYDTTIQHVKRVPGGKVRYPEYPNDGPDLLHRGALYEVTLLPVRS